MTTQLPEPDFTLDQGDEPCYYANTLSSYGADEYRRGIEDAAKVCERTIPNAATEFEAITAALMGALVRQLGEKS